MTRHFASDARSRLRLVFGVLVCSLLLGCDFETEDNLPNVPEEGLFIAVEANHHADEEETQVAAAAFRDGENVNMVGGDVFKAVNGSSDALLLKKGPIKGSYATSFEPDDLDLGMQISIVHATVESRENRWYPVDLINVDPGPGELVGPVAAVSFPPPVVITGPQPETTFTSLQETVDITWQPGGEGDQMVLRSATSCTDGLAVTTYGTEHDLGDDDGAQTLGINELIVDLDDEAPFLYYIENAARAMMQELLDKLSNGKIDPDYFARRATVNPATNLCLLDLYLFRVRDGVPDPSFDSGVVKGSRSQVVSIVYQSPLYTPPP